MDEEAVDWGEDEQLGGCGPVGDEEDAISLGGDVDELQEFDAFKSLTKQDIEDAPSEQRGKSNPVPPTNDGRRSDERHPDNGAERAENRVGEVSRERSPEVELATVDPKSSPPKHARKHSRTTMTHALPPKPITVSPPPPDTRREPRYGGRDDDKPLPPNWEKRVPTNPEDEHDVYYYNSITHESTRKRPHFGDRLDRSPVRARSNGTAQRPLNPDRRPRPPVNDQDRHYRPGGAPSEKTTDLGPSDDSRFVPNAAYVAAQTGPTAHDHGPNTHISSQYQTSKRDRGSSRWDDHDSQSRGRWSAEPGSAVSETGREHESRQWVPRDQASGHEPGPNWQPEHQENPARGQRSHRPTTTPTIPYEERSSRKGDSHWSSRPRSRSPPLIKEPQPPIGQDRPSRASFAGSGSVAASFVPTTRHLTSPRIRRDDRGISSNSLAVPQTNQSRNYSEDREAYSPSEHSNASRTRASELDQHDSEVKRRRTGNDSDSTRNRRLRGQDSVEMQDSDRRSTSSATPPRRSASFDQPPRSGPRGYQPSSQKESLRSAPGASSEWETPGYPSPIPTPGGTFTAPSAPRHQSRQQSFHQREPEQRPQDRYRGNGGLPPSITRDPNMMDVDPPPHPPSRHSNSYNQERQGPYGPNQRGAGPDYRPPGFAPDSRGDFQRRPPPAPRGPVPPPSPPLRSKMRAFPNNSPPPESSGTFPEERKNETQGNYHRNEQRGRWDKSHIPSEAEGHQHGGRSFNNAPGRRQDNPPLRVQSTPSSGPYPRNDGPISATPRDPDWAPGGTTPWPTHTERTRAERAGEKPWARGPVERAEQHNPAVALNEPQLIPNAKTRQRERSVSYSGQKPPYAPRADENPTRGRRMDEEPGNVNTRRETKFDRNEGSTQRWRARSQSPPSRRDYPLQGSRRATPPPPSRDPSPQYSKSYVPGPKSRWDGPSRQDPGPPPGRGDSAGRPMPSRQQPDNIPPRDDPPPLGPTQGALASRLSDNYAQPPVADKLNPPATGPAQVDKPAPTTWNNVLPPPPPAAVPPPLAPGPSSHPVVPIAIPPVHTAQLRSAPAPETSSPTTPYQAPPNRPTHPRHQSFGRRPPDYGEADGPLFPSNRPPGPPMESNFPPRPPGPYAQQPETRRPASLADRLQDPKDFATQRGDQWAPASGPSLKDRVEPPAGSGYPPTGYHEPNGGWYDRGPNAYNNKGTDVAGSGGDWENGARGYRGGRGRGRGGGDRGMRGRGRGGRGYNYQTNA